MTVLNTSGMRREWGPGCYSGPMVVINLHGTGRISVRPEVVDAWRAFNACLVKHGYETERHHTGAYNCRPITGGTGISPHGLGLPADINWQRNPYGKKLVTDMPAALVRDILAIRTVDGHRVFDWGGNWVSVKDAMHYDIVNTRAHLARGIDPRTVPGGSATPRPPAAQRPVPVRQQVPGTWRNGDSGEGVRFTQAMVNITRSMHKGPSLVTDGLFGNQTEGAVRAFQTFANAMHRLAGGKGITVDGITGKQTNGAIAFWVPIALKGG